MAIERDGFLLEERADGWALEGYEGNQVDLVIPEDIEGKPVVLIAARAFEGNRSVESIDVPESVTFIGNYAFASCPELQRACIRARIEALNLGTFWNCTALTDVQLPDSLKSLNDGVFRSCPSLPSVDVPKTVTFIGDSVFRECTGLTSAILDGQIQTIERSAYRGCTNLASVAISTTLTYLGTRVFQDCPALESVTLLGEHPEATLTAFRNHGFTYLVADNAVESGIVSFDEAKKLLNTSKNEAERVFAARVLVATPERLGEIFSKQLLARTLAGAGRTDELHVLEQEGMLSEAALQAGIQAAQDAGRTETAAYLLDVLACMQGNAPSASSHSLRL